MQLPHFERLEELVRLLGVEELNEGLISNDQIKKDVAGEAAAETIEAIRQLSYRNLLAHGDLNSMAASLKVKPNRKILMQYLDTNGINAFLKEMTESTLRYTITMLGQTWINRDYATEDLVFWAASTAARQFMTNIPLTTLRVWCEKLELSQSGDLETILDRLEEGLFPIPERDRQFSLVNDHADDKSLDGVAVVTRDTRGAPESVRLTSACLDLRRLLVLICNLSQDPTLAVCSDWNQWTTDGLASYDEYGNMEIEEESESRQEVISGKDTSGQTLLDPVFPLRYLQLAKTQIALLMEESTAAAEDDFITKTKKNYITQLKATYAMTGKLSSFKGLSELLGWLSAQAYPESSSNNVAFHNLHTKYVPGSFVKGTVDDLRTTPVGYYVVSACHTSVLGYVNNRYVPQWNFALSLAYIISNGTSFLWVSTAETMRDYAKELSMSCLPYEVVDAETARCLSLRGERYVKLSKGAQFMGHDEESFFASTASGIYQLTAKPGRIMLDIARGRTNGHHPGLTSSVAGSAGLQSIETWFANALMNKQTKQLYGAAVSTNAQDELQTVPPEYLAVCWPAITAFNFGLKKWGYVLVDSIIDIKFNDDAFDKLVLETSRKKLIHAVVKHSQDVFSDIIAGKGGGSIFLLHGPPGTGKTLTAEAVAEVLHKPLYYVSVGELGTTPESLETNLQAILDLASGWKAVLLMDEADVFLEQRGFKEVKRNAMVGVMLKLLEYYQGILFLTSNRVQTFDAAFYSRITVALRYDFLDQETRLSIWKMILKSMGINNVDPTELSHCALNGRQIKNCATLAQSLASNEKRDTTLDDLRQTTAICLDFIRDMEKQRSAELVGEFHSAPQLMKRKNPA